METLLATKLRPPPVPLKRVKRSHLTQKLNEGLETGRQITLVSAPAGFGKTTCISEWINSLPSYPVSWLSLDPMDNEPGRFFTYFVAALQRFDKSIGKEIDGVLRSGQIPPAGVISTILINDILRLEQTQSHLILVVDDLHVIQDQFVMKVLENLVANLPPLLHLVLLTREDPGLPLARVRANNRLTEIRAEDLRFSNAEAGCFLNETMGLSLSETDIATLEDRAEGWIAGLQLAGLSLRDRSNPSRYIAALSGNHRYIISYLTEEVLTRLPAETQDFLLQTSILDRLSGDLCNRVTGRTDSSLILERLYNANLFLIPLDDEQKWYRYHHLFADLLRNRQNMLYKDQTAELHRRASQGYIEADLPVEAIQHTLTAADYPAAVHLIEEYAMFMLVQGYARTVEDWMRAVPPEWQTHSPKTSLAFAWMYLLRGAFTQALPHVERLQSIFSGSPEKMDVNPSLMAEWLALQATLLAAQGRAEESLVLSNRALKIVPEKDNYVRSLIYMGLAGAYRWLDDYPHSVEAYQMIILHGQTGGNFVVELLGISGLIQMVLQHGKYHFAFEIATQAVERLEQLDTLSPISAAVYGSLGQVYFQWHQIELSHKYYLRAVQLSNLGGYSDAEIGYAVIRSRLYLMEGNLKASEQEIQKATGLMKINAPAWVREEVIAQQIRFLLALDNRAEAEETLAQHLAHYYTKETGIGEAILPAQNLERIVNILSSRLKIDNATGQLYNCALRILFYRYRSNNDEISNLIRGIELANYVIDQALQRQFIEVALEALLLRAQMHAARGNNQAGLADYTRALEIACPDGYITAFIEMGPSAAEALIALSGQIKNDKAVYIETILSAFSSLHFPETAPDVQPNGFLSPQSPLPVKNGVGPLVEPLTDRELDVLRLIADGLKYEEIAEQLFISLNTVRTYVKGIYGKLGVNNRSKAVALAQRYKLI